jgi:hypothetical protein
MCVRHLARSIALIVVASVSAPTLADSYSFVKIAGSPGAPTFLSEEVAINNLGAVAFARNTPNGVQTLLTGRGGALTKIADTAGPNRFIAGWDVNRNGVVAYQVGFDHDTVIPGIAATGVFTGNGKTNRLVAKSGGRIFSVGGAAINDRGQVALSTASEPFGGVTTVVTRYPDRLIAVSSDANLAAGDVNNQGVVAFSTFTVEDRMFIGSGGKPTVIAETEGTNLLLFQSSPRINESGVVAFNARLDSGGVGVFTANNPGVRKIVDNVTGPFAGLGLGNPAINNRGVVAFDANKFEFRAIYTGTDPIADRVIQTGDPLDGSTVQRLSTGSHGRYLNDAGQIAFWAQLADGRSGIYRADPLSLNIAAVPEPATLGLVAAAGLAVLIRRRLHHLAAAQ